MNNDLYESQKNKPFLLSLFVLDNKRVWIRPSDWDEKTLKLINDLSDLDYIIFWSIYRLIDIEYVNSKEKATLENIKSIVIRGNGYNSDGKLQDYNDVTELFKTRIIKIANENDIKSEVRLID